jgi:hypothetical protein
MTEFITTWLWNEDGAITVDWVVLTAAVVSLGVAAVAGTRGGVDALAKKIDNDVAVIGVGE